MPQEPQQVDLEELSRLYNSQAIATWRYEIHRAFPALRDELVRLREATKPVSRSNSDKFFENQVNEIGEKIVLRRQLDEAKGHMQDFTELAFEYSDSYEMERSQYLRIIGNTARAFLASLAGKSEGGEG